MRVTVCVCDCACVTVCVWVCARARKCVRVWVCSCVCARAHTYFLTIPPFICRLTRGMGGGYVYRRVEGRGMCAGRGIC